MQVWRAGPLGKFANHYFSFLQNFLSQNMSNLFRRDDSPSRPPRPVSLATSMVPPERLKVVQALWDPTMKEYYRASKKTPYSDIWRCAALKYDLVRNTEVDKRNMNWLRGRFRTFSPEYDIVTQLYEMEWPEAPEAKYFMMKAMSERNPKFQWNTTPYKPFTAAQPELSEEWEEAEEVGGDENVEVEVGVDYDDAALSQDEVNEA